MSFGVPTLALANGGKIPFIGLGTWQSKPGEVAQAVRIALECGYRHIDTAGCYLNEEDIGKILEGFFKDGKLKREDLFITTKLWCTHNLPEEVEFALRESLKKLKLDYVDMYLIHMPTAFDHEMKKPKHVKVEDTWKGMEMVFEKGLTKAIGVSNFSIEQIDRIQKSARVKIHNVQVECHLYFPQKELAEYCQRNHIVLTAYAPLGSPSRANWEVPQRGKLKDWKPSPPDLDDPMVAALTEKYKKSPAQVLLRYLIQRNIVVIPKSVSEKRIKENFDVFDFELTDTEVKKLMEPQHKQRLFMFEYMIGHPEDPFKKDREEIP